MLEIEEVIPQYEMACNDKKTTPNALYAKRQDSVIIFNAFMDRFFVYVDDMGRLICCEKEKEK